MVGRGGVTRVVGDTAPNGKLPALCSRTVTTNRAGLAREGAMYLVWTDLHGGAGIRHHHRSRRSLEWSGRAVPHE